jgi:hypothetical protein
LKSLPKLLALVGPDWFDMLGPAPGFIKDISNSADRLSDLLQAAVPLEDLLFRPLVIRDVGPGIIRLLDIHATSIIVLSIWKNVVTGYFFSVAAALQYMW